MQQHDKLWAVAALLTGLFAAGQAAAAPDSDARFKAGKSGEIRLANVSCKAAGDGAAAVRFDLSWDYSWRAAWAVEEGAHGGRGRRRPGRGARLRDIQRDVAVAAADGQHGTAGSGGVKINVIIRRF
jgi:hypothetical protein